MYVCMYNVTFFEHVVIVVDNDVIRRQLLGLDAGSTASRVHGGVSSSDLRVEVVHHLMFVAHEQV